MSNDVLLQAHTRQVAEMFNLASEGYDGPAVRGIRRCAERLVDVAELQNGERVLDIATGTAWAALAAAKAVGPSGRVVGVDVAEDMLHLARDKIAAAGVTNVEVRLADAEHLEFEDASFDIVLCASSVFFFPDMHAALREWTRVLRPGGRIAFSAFGGEAFQPVSDRFEAAIRSYGVNLPPHHRPFQWHRLMDERQCRALLRDAGLLGARTHAEQLGHYLPNAAAWWDFVLHTGFRALVTPLKPENLARFREEHLREVAALATKDGIWLDIPALFAIGHKSDGSSVHEGA